MQGRIFIGYMLKSQGMADDEIAGVIGRKRVIMSHYKPTIRDDAYTRSNIEDFIFWCHYNHRVTLMGLDEWVEKYCI